MAKSQPSHKDLPAAEPELSFEAALAELQRIVAELEDGNVGLQQSLQNFETGVGLLRDCYSLLTQAEQRIEILTGLDADGRPLTEPFDATATADQPHPSAGRRGRTKNDSTDDASESAARRLF